MNYKRIYDELILSRSKRDLTTLRGIVTETHHIVPRCLGGTDEKSNLVVLTSREHILAHLLLERVYPDNEKILFAAFCMVNGFGPNNRIKEAKTFSTTILSDLRDKYRKTQSSRPKELHPMWGRKHSPETIKKLSEARKKRVGFHHTEETKKKMSLARKGRKLSEDHKRHLSELHKGTTLSEETKRKMSESRRGENHPMYGRHHKESTKKKLSMKRSKNPIGAKKVFDSINNITFRTIKDCSDYYKVSRDAISWWIKHKPEKGLSFLGD